MLTSTIILMMDHINMSKLSPYQNDPPKPQDPTTVVPANRRSPPLDSGHYTKIGGMCNLKHDISSPTFYGQVPDQDVLSGIILWYTAKSIPTLLE